METYSFLRELADSWVLLALVLFYLAACLWAFRPGGRAANEEAAGIPLRNDQPVQTEESDCDGDCDDCPCKSLNLELNL